MDLADDDTGDRWQDGAYKNLRSIKGIEEKRGKEKKQRKVGLTGNRDRSTQPCHHVVCVAIHGGGRIPSPG
jgi:hypothetical protein